MSYRRFEILTIIIGAAAILGMLVASFVSGARVYEELFAQLLLLVVLIGAVHWQRTGGFITAIVATLVYIGMRTPLIVVSGGVSGDIAILILLRAFTYGALGIIGGEACGRIRAMLAQVRNATNIDEESLVYNERFVKRLIAANAGRHTRYGSVFAIVLLDIDSSLFDGIRPAKRRTAVRKIADLVRHDVRLVDDVGRLDDGTFVLVLPHTPKEGADIAADRVRNQVRDLLGAGDETIKVTILAAPDDVETLEALIESLQGPVTGHVVDDGARVEAIRDGRAPSPQPQAQAQPQPQDR